MSVPPRRTPDDDGLISRVPCRRLDLRFEQQPKPWKTAPQPEKTDDDWIANEAPLTIVLQGHPWAVLMRSPGNELELATGYLVTEGVARYQDIESVRHASIGEGADDVVVAHLREGVEVEQRTHRRRTATTSSCGLCGKTDARLALALHPPFDALARYSAQAATEALAHLSAQQEGFSYCGGLHAVGLADKTGRLVAVREDIGRHNALDKLIGWSLSQGLALAEHALVLSGRCSFEMVQKALAARCPTVIAIGAVSGLAVQVAQRSRMTLVGFARESRMTVYTGELR